jgi:hypothetical protein
MWMMERFYLAVPTGTANANDRVLVYDVQHRWWTIYDLPVKCLAEFRVTDQPTGVFGRLGGLSYVKRGAENDDGRPIRSLWRSGWGDYGNSQQKTIRETKLWGSGAAIVSFAIDFDPVTREAIDTVFALKANWPAADLWSDWQAELGFKWPQIDQVADTLVRRATRGTVFSTQFSSSPDSPVWSVHRVARHLREVRGPSVL